MCKDLLSDHSHNVSYLGTKMCYSSKMISEIWAKQIRFTEGTTANAVQKESNDWVKPLTLNENINCTWKVWLNS